VSIRELAAEANVNVAAIHYHFGGKEVLYGHVLRHVLADTLSAMSMIEAVLKRVQGAGTKSAARQGLRDCVAILLRSLFSDNRTSCIASLLLRESADPSEAFNTIWSEFLEPQWSAFCSLLEILRPDFQSQPELLRLTASSILGQCLFYLDNPSLVTMIFGHEWATEGRLSEIAVHIAAFSLHGISQKKESTS
jgi:AcrR family transcriptional regulator